jgi:hypothetical protein
MEYWEDILFCIQPRPPLPIGLSFGRNMTMCNTSVGNPWFTDLLEAAVGSPAVKVHVIFVMSDIGTKSNIGTFDFWLKRVVLDFTSGTGLNFSLVPIFGHPNLPLSIFYFHAGANFHAHVRVYICSYSCNMNMKMNTNMNMSIDMELNTPCHGLGNVYGRIWKTNLI